MDLTKLSIADIYAIKSEAKAKQSYYQTLRYAAELSGTEVQAAQEKIDLWGDRLYKSDQELLKRIDNL